MINKHISSPEEAMDLLVNGTHVYLTNDGIKSYSNHREHILCSILYGQVYSVSMDSTMDIRWYDERDNILCDVNHLCDTYFLYYRTMDVIDIIIINLEKLEQKYV